jgi:uncharacterized membrane protein
MRASSAGRAKLQPGNPNVGVLPEATSPRSENARTAPRTPYLMLALALLGIADAFYVAHGSYTGEPLWCVIVDGCNIVVASPYARIAGVPASYLGLTFYLFMSGLAALLAMDPFSRGLRLGALLYAVLGVGYSTYFAYVQLSLIRAVCIYCAISGLLTMLLLIAALWHFRATRAPTTG